MSISSTRHAAPTLRLYRSLWGLTVDPKSSSATTSPSSTSSPKPPPCRGIKFFPSRQALLRHITGAGRDRVGSNERGRKGGLYHGIEASLCDLGSTKEERRDMVRMLEEHGLDLIIGIYSSWGDYECRHDHYKAPSLHIAQFQSQLEEALALGPVHVNSHTGCDAWREDKDIMPFFEMVLEAQRAMGSEISISHETHRGRPLGNPFLTLRLLHALPSLRLTADISHWMVVCERLLGGREGGREGEGLEEELLRTVAGRTDHVHARRGNAQSAQVVMRGRGGRKEDGKDKRKEERGEREVFERFWRWVQEAKRERGRGVWTVTPEYGPGYGGGGEMDVDKVNEDMARWLRTKFGSM